MYSDAEDMNSLRDMSQNKPKSCNKYLRSSVLIYALRTCIYISKLELSMHGVI